MDPARPLRDVFADLVGDESARQAHAADPDGFLQAAGHPELPDSLVSEAIVSYAETAPAEVAEHLAPFVMAHSPVPVEDDLPVDERDAMHGLVLLTSAPAGPVPDEDLALDAPLDAPLDADAAADLAGPEPGHLIAEPDGTGHEIAGHEIAGHEIAGHEIAGHEIAGHEIAGHEIADPFALDFGHGDSGGPVPAGHLDPADLGTDLPDHLQVAAADAGDGPDWLGDPDHPDQAAHLDPAADLDQPDHVPDHLPDVPGTDEHGPDDVADL